VSYGLRRVAGETFEVCDECGFDGRAVGDEVAALTAAFHDLARLIEQRDAEQRPEPEVWSAREYADHIVGITNDLASRIADACRKPPAPLATTLDDAAAVARSVATSLTERDRSRMCTIGALRLTCAGTLLHLLHDVQHHVLDVRRGYARLALSVGDDIHTVTR
jgi:hypothetical protein